MAEKKKYLDYEGLERLVAKLKEGGGNDLVTQEEDETYVLKAVDGEGNLLVGFKESGEIEVPTGLTDDAYALIEALYEKMSETVNYIKALPTSGGSDLIVDGTDSQYVMKAVDADGNLLQGVKGNGEVEIPIGISDDGYTLFTSVYNKLDEIAQYLENIK